MRWRIVHACRYDFDRPALEMALTLRLTPMPWPRHGQAHAAISIVPRPAARSETVDALGTPVTRARFDRPLSRLAVSADVEVEGGSDQTLPVSAPTPSDSALDGVPAGLAATASALRDTADTPESTARTVVAGVLAGWEVDATGSSPETPLAVLWRRRRGICQDFARIAVAGARAAGLPARFIVGYRAGRHPFNRRVERHAWVAVHVAGNWLELDPTPAFAADGVLIATAWGPDFAALNPVAGSFSGGAVARLNATTQIEPA